MDWDGVIAAMDHAIDERFAKAFGDVAATDGGIECAGITVEILEALGHANKDVEVVGIKETALGGAMGGDGCDAAFEGQGEDAWIGVFGANDGQGVFTAGVGEEGQFGFGHAFPELGEAAIVAVDVVAVGKDFHYGRAAGEATVEFFEGVGPGGMDGDGGDKFGMFPGEVQDVIVRDVMGADVFHFLRLVVVNFVLGENDNCAEGGTANQIE